MPTSLSTDLGYAQGYAPRAVCSSGLTSACGFASKCVCIVSSGREEKWQKLRAILYILKRLIQIYTILFCRIKLFLPFKLTFSGIFWVMMSKCDKTDKNVQMLVLRFSSPWKKYQINQTVTWGLLCCGGGQDGGAREVGCDAALAWAGSRIGHRREVTSCSWTPIPLSAGTRR